MTRFTKQLALVLGTAVLAMNSATFGATDATTNAGPTDAASTNAPPAKPAVKADDLFPDPVVVKAKGFEIKRSQMDDALISIKGSLPANGQKMPPNEIIEQQIVDRLIQIQLLMGRATAEDKAKGKAAFEKELQAVKTNMKTSEEEFADKLNRQLRAQGLTRAQWEKQRTELATISAVLERELKGNVTDEDVKKFYTDNPAKFEQPEMVRASHILLSTRDATTRAELSDEAKKAKRKQIDDLLKRARDGEDFAKLAKEFSEDPGSKDKGGEYTFPRGQMVPEFEAAAFSLKTNQISDVVTTPFGYHIIKLSEKIPARKVELAKASEDIKQFLNSQQIQKQMPAFLEKLKKEAGVEILDERFKAKEPPKAAAAESGKSDKKEAASAPEKK
jgi:parvulin-like peptidyl-prolyl isomerase